MNISSKGIIDKSTVTAPPKMGHVKQGSSGCFICLKEVSETTSPEASCNSLLRNIARYVNAKDPSANRVGVCRSCANFLSNFNHLYPVMEEARRLLQQFLRDLVEVMEQADCRVKSSGRLNTVGDAFQERRRQAFVGKCQKKMRSDIPPAPRNPTLPAASEATRFSATIIGDLRQNYFGDRIPSIEKSHRETPPSFILKPKQEISGVWTYEPSTQDPALSAPSLPNDLGQYEDTVQDEPLNLIVARGPASYQVPEDSSTSEFNHSLNCTYCSRQFSKSYIDLHYATVHPEHQLLQQKLPSLSQPQFKELIRTFLLPKLLKPGPCTECGHSWSLSVKLDVRRKSVQCHYFKKHLDYLLKEVKALQQKQVVLSHCARFWRTDDDGGEALIECEFCGVKVQLNNEWHHKRYNCQTRRDNGRTEQCNICGRWVAPATLQHHVKLGACKKTSATDTNVRKRMLWASVECYNCEKEIDLPEWDAHKANCKGNEAKATAKPIPSRRARRSARRSPANPSPQKCNPCEHCGKKLTSTTNLRNHQRFACSKLKKLLAACKGCGKLMHPLIMKTHLQRLKCLEKRDNTGTPSALGKVD